MEIEENGTIKIQLKNNHMYYTQIQGQMAFTKRHLAYFFVFTHHGYHIERITFDSQFWFKVEKNLILFWFDHLAPRILKISSEKAKLEKNNSPGPSDSEIIIDETTLMTESNEFTSLSQKQQKPIGRKLTFKMPKVYLCGVCKRILQKMQMIFSKKIFFAQSVNRIK